MTHFAIRRLSSADAAFDALLSRLTAWEVSENDAITVAARDIVADVRARGDDALLEHTRRFDRLACTNVAALEIGAGELAACARQLLPAERTALEDAAARIRAFHEAQRVPGFEIVDALGNRLGNRVAALERVGVYVP